MDIYLREYRDAYVALGDVYRARAYTRALTTLANGDAMTASMTKRLEMLARGEIPPDLLALRATVGVLRELGSLYGVGPEIATAWYRRGIRSLRDVRVAVRDGKLTLTHAQTIGLKYYKQLHTRIPRDVITAFAAEFRVRVSPFVVIAGSYRRGAADSGDIDLLVYAPVRPRMSDILLAYPPVAVFSSGTEKTSAVYRINARVCHVDIICVREEQAAAALLYLTGGAEFNERMRGYAKSMGYRLNQHGLYRNGVLVPTSTERDIFAKLGMKYVTPALRYIHA